MNLISDTWGVGGYRPSTPRTAQHRLAGIHCDHPLSYRDSRGVRYKIEEKILSYRDSRGVRYKIEEKILLIFGDMASNLLLNYNTQHGMLYMDLVFPVTLITG